MCEWRWDDERWRQVRVEAGLCVKERRPWMLAALLLLLHPTPSSLPCPSLLLLLPRPAFLPSLPLHCLPWLTLPHTHTHTHTFTLTHLPHLPSHSSTRTATPSFSLSFFSLSEGRRKNITLVSWEIVSSIILCMCVCVCVFVYCQLRWRTRLW